MIEHHPMRMRVPVSNKEANKDIDEEGDLAGNVKEEQILGQTSEETKL